MKEQLKQLKKKICQCLQPKARKGWLWLIPIGISLLAAGGLWIWASAAGGIGKVVVEIVAWLSKILVGVLSWIIGLAVQTIIGVAQYNNFINEEAVKTGWSILRDIGNMFFIILFLVMAVGTILKKEQYSWQKMLIPIVLVAIFVNFSKSICGLVIDFCQVIMLTFVNAFKDVGAGNLINLFGLRQLLELSREGGQGINPTGVSDMGMAATYLLASIFAFVAAVVMIIVVVVLILRVVALWFLVVLSPLAFICYVVPGLQRYAKQWQDKFFSQAIIGPVLAFFLWLAFYAVQTGLQSEFGMSDYLGEGVSSETAAVLPIIGSPRFLSIFILGSGMLIGALIAAKQLGVAGAGLAGQGVGFLQKSGAAVVSKTAGWAARRADAVRQKAFKYGGGAGVGLIGAGFKSAAFSLTGRGKEIGGIWQEYREKSLKPLWAPVRGFLGAFGKGKAEANIAQTQGWDALLDSKGTLAGKISFPADLNRAKELYKKGIDSSLTEDEKKEMKAIISRSSLTNEAKKQYERRTDEDYITQIQLDHEETEKQFDSAFKFLTDMLRKAGVQEKGVRDRIIASLKETAEGKEIKEMIRNGGGAEADIKRVIETMMDYIPSGQIMDSTTGAMLTFDGKKIDQDQLKNGLEKIVSPFSARRGKELASVKGGTEGTIRYEIGEMAQKYKLGTDARKALDGLYAGIDGKVGGELNLALKNGIVSITNKNKIKKEIAKELEALVKAGTIEEIDADKIKEKITFQVEAIPIMKLTNAELAKQITEKVGKWTGKKLSVPFSLVAATFESLRDQAGIPIFDLDILFKDIKNFNARRTRRREADKMGQWHDVMNLWASWDKDKTDFKGSELMSRVGEEKKLVFDKTQGETHATLNELYDAWQSGDHSKALGAYMILAENNDLNELWKGDFSGKFLPIMRKMLETQYLGKTVKVWNETSKTHIDKKIDRSAIDGMIQTSRQKGEVNVGFARLFTENLTRLAGKSDAVAAKLGNMIGMIALEHGSPHMGYAAASYNPKAERMEFAPLEMRLDTSGRLELSLSRRSMGEINAKLKNMSQRKVTNMIHPGMFAQEDINGAMRGIGAHNESFLMTLSSTLLERPHEMRDDVVSKLTSSSEWKNGISNLVADMRTNPEYFLRYYSDYFSSLNDVLKQAELIREFPIRLEASRFKSRV